MRVLTSVSTSYLPKQVHTLTATQGKRIKIQAHYECRRHDTPAKPRVKWGQSPIWNPGYTRTKSNIELRRSGTITRAFVLRLRSAAPLGLNRCVPIINPGLAPWAMQEYRPYRAPLHLPYHFIILMRLPWFIYFRNIFFRKVMYLCRQIKIFSSNKYK